MDETLISYSFWNQVGMAQEGLGALCCQGWSNGVLGWIDGVVKITLSQAQKKIEA